MAFRSIFSTSLVFFARKFADSARNFSIFLDGKVVNSVYIILVILILVEINNEGAFRFSKG